MTKQLIKAKYIEEIQKSKYKNFKFEFEDKTKDELAFNFKILENRFKKIANNLVKNRIYELTISNGWINEIYELEENKKETLSLENIENKLQDLDLEYNLTKISGEITNAYFKFNKKARLEDWETKLREVKQRIRKEVIEE